MNDLARQDPAELQKFSAENLLTEAVGKNVSVETIERLLVMRRELKQEHAREVFDSAMVGFKAERPPIKKTKEVMNKDGRTVRYRYAPIDEIDKQITPTLAKFGFSYSFRSENRKDAVVEVCIVTHKLGHSIESPFEIPIDPDAYMNDGQKVASASSMAKRYALKGALGLIEVGEDDDAQALGQGGTPQDLYKKFCTCMEATLNNIDSIVGIKECLANDDFNGAAQLYEEIDNKEIEKIWVAPSKGGPFTTEERATLREKVNPIVKEMRSKKNA